VPLRGTLRYSRRPGSGETRYAQTSARPDPAAAALLSTAYGLGSPRVLVRFAHLAHTGWRASRCYAAALTPHPLTTTASFTNRGNQTRTESSRTNTRIRRKKA